MHKLRNLGSEKGHSQEYVFYLLEIQADYVEQYFPSIKRLFN